MSEKRLIVNVLATIVVCIVSLVAAAQTHSSEEVADCRVVTPIFPDGVTSQTISSNSAISDTFKAFYELGGQGSLFKYDGPDQPSDGHYFMKGSYLHVTHWPERTLTTPKSIFLRDQRLLDFLSDLQKQGIPFLIGENGFEGAVIYDKKDPFFSTVNNCVLKNSVKPFMVVTPKLDYYGAHHEKVHYDDFSAGSIDEALNNLVQLQDQGQLTKIQRKNIEYFIIEHRALHFQYDLLLGEIGKVFVYYQRPRGSSTLYVRSDAKTHEYIIKTHIEIRLVPQLRSTLKELPVVTRLSLVKLLRLNCPNEGALGLKTILPELFDNTP